MFVTNPHRKFFEKGSRARVWYRTYLADGTWKVNVPIFIGSTFLAFTSAAALMSMICLG